jgi:hypothetical protein
MHRGVALSIPFGIKFKVESVGLATPLSLLFESLLMTWDLIDLQDTLVFSCNRLTYVLTVYRAICLLCILDWVALSWTCSMVWPAAGLSNVALEEPS